MYHWIVKKRLTNSFKALNEGRYDVISSFIKRNQHIGFPVIIPYLA